MRSRFNFKRMLILIVIGVTSGLLLLCWPVRLPPPPDFSGESFAAVSADLNGRYSELDEEDFRQRSMGTMLSAKGKSQDSAMIEQLIDLIRTSRPTTRCRCAILGRLRFFRTDGTFVEIYIMPAHGDTVEFIYQRGRFVIERKTFLDAVKTMGITPERWYESAPYIEPVVALDAPSNISFWKTTLKK